MRYRCEIGDSKPGVWNSLCSFFLQQSSLKNSPIVCFIDGKLRTVTGATYKVRSADRYSGYSAIVSQLPLNERVFTHVQVSEQYDYMAH